MKKYIFEGKNFDEVKSKAINELNVSEEDMIIKVLEEKQGLLKKSIKIPSTITIHKFCKLHLVLNKNYFLFIK